LNSEGDGGTRGRWLYIPFRLMMNKNNKKVEFSKLMSQMIRERRDGSRPEAEIRRKTFSWLVNPSLTLSQNRQGKADEVENELIAV
jgi:hypothetical protein